MQREMLPEFKLLAELVAEKQSLYYDALREKGFSHRAAMTFVEQAEFQSDFYPDDFGDD